MEKRKPWHLFIIFAVVVLTLYNILPTVFYYAQPLKKPIDEKAAHKVATGITKRIDSLEPFTVKWLQAQSKNLGMTPRAIVLDKENPRIARATFKTAQEATRFGQVLGRAGALISFVPAQLSPELNVTKNQDETTLLVQRKLGLHLDAATTDALFHYIPKETAEGVATLPYREIINDRTSTMALLLAGESPTALWIYQSPAVLKETQEQEALIRTARKIVEYERTFGDQSNLTQRFYGTFSQLDSKKATPASLIAKFQEQLASVENTLGKEIENIKKERDEKQKSGGFLDTATGSRLEILENQQQAVAGARIIVARNRSLFEKGQTPLNREQLLTALNQTSLDASKSQRLTLGNLNPFVAALVIDWNKDLLEIELHPDILQLRGQKTNHELAAIEVEKVNQLLYGEIARASQGAEESPSPTAEGFVVEFNKITNSSSLLALDLSALAKLESKNLEHFIQSEWQPKLADFSAETFTIGSKADVGSSKLGMILYSPLVDGNQEGFRNGSIYVIVKGWDALANKFEKASDSPEKKLFTQDVQRLRQLMRQSGFIGYSAKQANLAESYKNDYIFELPDFYSYLLAASREEFTVKGSKRLALLEFTDHEQRLLTLNKIEDQIHQDLVTWRDNYNQVRVNMNKEARFEVPKPYQSVFVQNILLSGKKYFRGDQRKILKWGLDLSGGKTVRIALKDQNNKLITDPDDLHAAVNELYQRVNRLGLSEVAIRVEGSNISVDFPGSQALSASDLIQASAMYFHIVNETFSPLNSALSEAVSTFLEGVWNEAVITNRSDPESINLIAWQHLGGNPDQLHEFNPLTSQAQLLYNHGLRIAHPKAQVRSSSFNDEFSMVTRYRGQDFTDWAGQTHPLLIVFNNYALEGSNLNNVQAGYDPQEGNMLHFGVEGSSVNRLGQKSNPRDEFYRWTSQFSEESIAGSAKEKISHGRGWRMAVLLNGTVISAPTLNSPLRDSARISGHFSQAEVNKLAADLKAGSLSFTPEILSEENVSPDLGKEQRTQGIIAGLLGILLVTVMMCGYYRFAGCVAVGAVLFNLFIVWAVLQNLGAALTLPGIAGIILAVGMAVDANVLVFERFREEFALSKRLGPALQAGYKKAFTAIVDSNLTTIIAAVILLNFDSGPIKGFALTLIIGILSSMFTSLFMTRTFFAIWVQKTKSKELKMMQIFHTSNYDFIGKSKKAFTAVILILVVGGFFFFNQRHSMIGMDFTGGYALTLRLEEQAEGAYRGRAAAALEKAGVKGKVVQIRELNKPYLLRLQLAQTIEQPGQPFYGIDQKEQVEHPLFAYQDNPRIVWIVEALERGGLKINDASLKDLQLHWTQVSGQLSGVMRNQALIGLALALLAILIYVTFRFEFKYAISATLALAHDLLVTLAFMGIFHLFFPSVQIDLEAIAALMTIVGYSLNDTIIIFDRIREDLKFSRKRPFKEVVNHAINETLSRTIMTSSTTCVVLLALVFMGGGSIFNFALIMTLGVLIGTFSSIFIAAPLLIFFHQRGQEKTENHGVLLH